jgi:hypothetical protein
MDGDEQLPEGWIKVKSKSKPGKEYYFHKIKKISIWSLDDLKKNFNGDQKHRPKHSPSKTPSKPPSGTSIHSKNIKKNVARERMKELQSKLASEVKHDRKQDLNFNKLQAFKDVVQVKQPRTSVSLEPRNVALKRMEKMTKSLKTEVEAEKQKSSSHPPPSLKLKVPNNLSKTEAKSKNLNGKMQTSKSAPVDDDTEMMDVSFEEPVPEIESSQEPMEWEDIPEQEVILKVQNIRSKAGSSSADSNSVSRQDWKTNKVEFYIIVDTNVLLSNVDFLKDVKGKMFKGELNKSMRISINIKITRRHRKSNNLPPLHCPV